GDRVVLRVRNEPVRSGPERDRCGAHDVGQLDGAGGEVRCVVLLAPRLAQRQLHLAIDDN
ncbi:MAG TPA: hypothetical protein VNA88_13490, partial [Candidatus Kapabacteria bacterium]|nr:hypothetical protein [Candidatus Kapabacteria bacterium]